MFMTFRDLTAEQGKDLDYKIAVAVEWIGKALAVSKHRVALAFSAGKDSTVLWHLLRTSFPHQAEAMAVIYGNTGVEYPECVRFAHLLQEEWASGNFYEARPARTECAGFKYAAQRRILERLVAERRHLDVLKPDGKLKKTESLERACPADLRAELEAEHLTWPAGSLQSYWWCVDQFGWPLLGKARSKLDAHRINIDCFLRWSDSVSDDPKLLAYYDLLRQCKFSQHCCKILKKEPAERVQAGLDVDVIFKGLMASESRARQTNFVTRGFLFQSHRPHLSESDPFYHCSPLAIWTDEDIWEYIHRFNVPYAPLYDMGFVGRDGQVHKIKRNGCMGCGTDILFRNNHMATLRRTHPKQWQVFMKKGMAEQIQLLRRAIYTKKRRGQLSLLDSCDAEFLLENRPCAFDDLGELAFGEEGGIEEEADFDPESE